MTGGHERACPQCGGAYQAARSTSRFCSGACRVRHHRGSDKGTGKEAAALRSWLLKWGYAAKLGDRLTLTAPSAFIHDELNAAVAHIRDRGLRSRLPAYSEGAFKAALRSLRIAH